MGSSLVLSSGGFTADLLSLTSSYQLSQNYDYGDPEAVLTQLDHDDSDGAIVIGERSANRKLTLTVQVFATSRPALAASTSLLLLAVASPFSLTYTPSGGLPVVWDCFRAQANTDWSNLTALSNVRTVTLTFQALPYGRTPDLVLIDADTVVPSLIESFDSSAASYTVTGGTATTDTVNKTQGTAALRIAPTPGTGYPSVSVTRSVTSFDMVDRTLNVIVDFRFDSTNGYGSNGDFGIPKSLTLQSAGGSRTTTAVNYPSINTNGGYQIGSFLFGGGSATETGTFDPTAIIGFIMVFEGFAFKTGDFLTVDNLRVDRSGASTGSGAYLFGSVKGDARAPLALQLTSATDYPWLIVHSAPRRPAAFSAALVNGTPTSPLSVTLPKYAYRGQFAVFASIQNAGGTVTGVSATLDGKTLSKSSFTAQETGTSLVLVELGFISLPSTDVDPSNIASTFGVSAFTTGTGGSVYVLALYLLDTQGEAVILKFLPSTLKRIYLDPPGPGQPLPRIVGSPSGTTRTDATSLTPYLSGTMHPFVRPGGSQLLITGSTSVQGSYYPRWQAERSM